LYQVHQLRSPAKSPPTSMDSPARPAHDRT
jgi:hypothetical protein